MPASTAAHVAQIMLTIHFAEAVFLFKGLAVFKLQGSCHHEQPTPVNVGTAAPPSGAEFSRVSGGCCHPEHRLPARRPLVSNQAKSV